MKRVEKECEYCGKTFHTPKSTLKYRKVKYCSWECYNTTRSQRIQVTCQVCGKVFKVHPSRLKQGDVKYCSRQCMGKATSGPNCPLWKGGVSFEPYCPKFNNDFKERVRTFWNRKCGVCGKPEHEDVKKLHVHHVNYDKQTCCNTTIPLFIALCSSHHSHTNNNRPYWEHVLTDYIMVWYDGESYLPASVEV